MPYDSAKDPWHGFAISPVGLGRSGAPVVPSDTTDLPRYARLRVFAPTSLASAQVSVLPVQAEDGVPLTLPVAVGQASVLEFMVRRVLATGTTAGLVLHSVE
ncbi:MAG TPA: hypothetical protein VLA00_17115 [Xanthobacteraceae bacterium]|nr:hypothetical protein [Xanthobacteraceae bacterium]